MIAIKKIRRLHRSKRGSLIPEDIKLEILSGISEALSDDISLDQIGIYLEILLIKKKIRS